MARQVVPLNDTQLKKCKSKDKNYTLADGGGLQLLVKTNGSKLWEFIYNSPTHHKRRKTSFGTYPTVSLKQARSKRQEYRALVVDGIDPIDHFNTLIEKQKEEAIRNQYSIGKAVDDYFEESKTKYAKKTIKNSKGRLENHFYKFLKQGRNTPLASLKSLEIKHIFNNLEHDDKLETLLKIRNLLINIFKHAMENERLSETTEFVKLELIKTKKRDSGDVKNNTTLVSPNSIRELYNSFLNYSHNELTKYLLLISIHTAQRQGSITTAKWEDFNLTNEDIKIKNETTNIDTVKYAESWLIPKENMKGKVEHLVPLSKVVLKYLKQLYKITGDGIYLFPNSQSGSRIKNPHISNNTSNNALRLMGYTKEQQTAHGFRAMFKTICKENQEIHNLNNEFVERVLAHKVSGKVEAAYDRSMNIEDKRNILNWWGNWLESLID